jgi:serine O-acetyltransferase
MRNFKPTLDESQLLIYVDKQLNNFFPDNISNLSDLALTISRAYERVAFCFSKIKGKYFSTDEDVFFNHLNGDHYCMFLYFASREAYLMNYENYYLKLSLLNKHLFFIDLFGHIEMPNIFLLVHPLGTIIGRAKFSDYLVIYQGVTIGGIHKPHGIEYPSFGEGTVCYSNTSILGKTNIGKDSIIAANTEIIGGDFSENSILFGKHPKLVEKISLSVATESFFRFEINKQLLQNNSPNL